MGARPRGPRRLGGGPERSKKGKGAGETTPAEGWGARPPTTGGQAHRPTSGQREARAAKRGPAGDEGWPGKTRRGGNVGARPSNQAAGWPAHWTAPRDGAEASEGLRVGGAGGGEEATPQQPRCTPPPRLQSGRQTPPRSPGACRGRTTS